MRNSHDFFLLQCDGLLNGEKNASLADCGGSGVFMSDKLCFLSFFQESLKFEN